MSIIRVQPSILKTESQRVPRLDLVEAFQSQPDIYPETFLLLPSRQSFVDGLYQNSFL